MNEQDLFAAWHQPDQNEKQLYKDLKGEYESLARQKSGDVFRKIQRNIYAEIAASLLIMALVLWNFFTSGSYFIAVDILFATALILGARIYYQYLKDLKKVNTRSLVEELQRKQAILSRYVRQQYFYLYLFMPAGFYTGMYYALQDTGITMRVVLILAAITTPVLLLMLWLGKKYIHVMYGQYLKQIEDVIKGFEL